MTKNKIKANSGAIRNSLADHSPLRHSVRAGLQALGGYSTRVDDSAVRVIDSLDFDTATTASAPEANRWDYFLGARSNGVIGVEVHSATDGDVRVVIAKKNHSKSVMQEHLKDGITVTRWVWIASGNVKFSPNSKYLQLLAQNRIEFGGRKLLLEQTSPK